ncbi:MAG: hypothetical protein IJ736_13820 [Firmicutes bacterium]|nr:hypothetical protein [Bacillota bacterium]
MKEYRCRIEKIYCNMWGEEIKKADGGEIFDDHLSVDKNWGYFSGKDGENHSFDICERCYDKIIGEFKIPVQKK